MKLAVGILLFSALAAAQTYQIPLWNGSRYVWVSLGSGLSVSNNTLTVAAPAPAVSVRKYGTKLVYDATVSGYRLPTGAKNLVVHQNGIRNFETTDYTVAAGVLKMTYAALDADIRIDYEE